MAEEEEVQVELEAVQAVYGDECVVIIDSFPPHIHLHLKPRTADVSSQQFVEAVVGVRAGPKYPEEPPVIYLIDSKGLDGERQKQMISSIQATAHELTSCLMLVAICEEAVERLSIMNHPDGDCPLCLYPLVPEGDQSTALPFMKLMSCFHCFHSECIIRWWNWLQIKEDADTKKPSSTTLKSLRDRGNQEGDESIGNCPVCRKAFHAKDFEHVLDLVDSHSSRQISDGTEASDDEFLKSESENIRRQKFESILKLQQDNSGLIEPKKTIAVSPGMYLQTPVTSAPPAPTKEATNQQEKTTAPSSIKETTNQQQGKTAARPDTNSSSSSNRPSSSKHQNSGPRRYRGNHSRKPVAQWVRRDNGNAAD